MFRAFAAYLIFALLCAPHGVAAVRKQLPPDLVDVVLDDGRPIAAIDRKSVKAMALQFQPSLAASRASIREAEAASPELASIPTRSSRSKPRGCRAISTSVPGF